MLFNIITHNEGSLPFVQDHTDSYNETTVNQWILVHDKFERIIWNSLFFIIFVAGNKTKNERRKTGDAVTLRNCSHTSRHAHILIGIWK